MRRFLRCGFVFSCLVTTGVSSAFAQPGCDRVCLRTMLDQYLNAVIKHDSAAAPLVVGFRQTENAVNVRPGSGVWRTVTGLGAMQRRYVDAAGGQASWFSGGEPGAGLHAKRGPITKRHDLSDRRFTVEHRDRLGGTSITVACQAVRIGRPRCPPTSCP